MSLATRCTACGTVFRVVQDQLKISEGWVRCGRCKEVFNALESVFDLDHETPPEWRPSQPTPLESVPADQHPRHAPVSVSSAPAWPPASSPAPLGAAESRPGALDASASASRPGPLSRPAAPPPPPPAPTPAPSPTSVPSWFTPAAVDDAAIEDSESPPADAREFADARFNPALLSEAERVALADPSAALPAAAAPKGPVSFAQEPEAPGFVRDAHARERWRHPQVRMALTGTVAMLSLLLLVQIGVHFRDGVAARWPSTGPLLAFACGCEIAAPHRLEEVEVESSGLTRAGVGADGDLLRLDITLRNRGATIVAMPTIDLKLTDLNGALVVRRMLSAADFQRRDDVLEAGSETPLRLQFTTGDLQVAGYTIELFYP